MRVLVITFTFPPSSHANAKRPYYICKAMVDAGWEVDVVTSQIGMDEGSDELIRHPNCRIRRLEDPVWSLATTYGRGTRWEKAVGLAANGLLWPESCRWWVQTVFSTVAPEIDRYDRVLAFVFPPSVLLAGERDGLVDRRWIIDYQESISPHYALHPRRSPLQIWLTPKLARVERATLGLAGRVVFTAETNRLAYIGADLVEASKTKLIPHFYDSEVFANPGEVMEDFVIGYFGYFDLRGWRTPEIFLRALAGFLERHPEARSRTRFVFYGKWLPEHDPMIDDQGLRDITEIHDSVPLHEYLELVKTCPVLLLLTAAELNLFMPSKVVEYLGAGRPILAFVPPESEVAGVLHRAGMGEFSCGERDVEGGIAALGRLWELFGASQLLPSASSSASWSSATQVPEYLRLLAGEAAQSSHASLPSSGATDHAS